MKTLKIGVLASGRGSNFQAIIDSIETGYIQARINVLITDNPKAFSIERAEKHGIESLVMLPKNYASRDEYFRDITAELKKRDVELVVLAGFMRIVGKPLLDAYPNSVMNIHPALLPSFPGLHGQKQAHDYGVKITGCTVHFVDEGMDTGSIIIQAAVPVRDDDTEETLSERILSLEHKIFPEAIKIFSEGRIEMNCSKVRIKGVFFDESPLINPPLGNSVRLT
jgi:phosphoribosylglycinamide formyltransferase-1